MKHRKAFHVIVILSFLVGIFGTQPGYALGTPQIVSINPSSPAQVGTCVAIRVRVNWDDEYRAMRVRFGGEGWQESSEVEFERTFCTGNLSPGWYTIRVEVARKGDNDWANPNVTETQYELVGQPEPPPPTEPPQPSKGPVISQFSFNPSSGAKVGDSVNIHIKVDSSNPGATKINVGCGGVSKIETSEVEFDSNWNTNECAAETFNILVCSRHVNDPNWTNPTCATKQYTLSPNQQSIPAPSVQFSADAQTIQQGQCTYLRWQISNADQADIDGTPIYFSGDMQVCPTVTKKYTLTATGPGGPAYRNLTIVVSGLPPSANPVDSFQTSNVIQISNDIFVIVNGERRLVPNPATLDALGITRSWINNKGFSDSELKTIPRGEDIPDVLRDPDGFAAFKNTYFSNTTPIVPSSPSNPNPPSQPQNPNPGNNSSSSGWQVGARVGLCAGAPIRRGSGFSYPTHTIVPENNWQVDIIDGPRYADGVNWWNVSRKNIDGGGTGWIVFEQASSGCNSLTPLPKSTQAIIPVPLEEQSQAEENPFFCDWPIIGFLFCESAADAQAAKPVNTTCSPQCITEARRNRPDIAQWSTGGTSDNIWSDAQEAPLFLWNNQLHFVKVRDLSSDTPQSGDLVVWPSACEGAWNNGGHIGFVESYGDGVVYVTDSNWFPTDGDTCTRRDNQPVRVVSCMQFITSPILIGDITPESAECTIAAQAYTDPARGGRILAIPLNPLPNDFTIYFEGNVVPNSNWGVRHDGYAGESTDGYTYLGIATRWVLWPPNWNWEESDKWKVSYPCP